KVAVIDSGYLPSGPLKDKPVAFYDAKGQPTPYFDREGHGTAVTNLIAQACPDSSFMALPFSTPQDSRDLNRRIAQRQAAYIQECLKNPEALTLAGCRQIFMPTIEAMGQAVRQAVDKGA